MADFWVSGIVAMRDKQPYIQLSNEKGMIAQLSMGEARQVAQDILVMASRTEADAMVHKFFESMDSDPAKAAEMSGLFMVAFREFRAKLDDEAIEHDHRGDVP